MLRLTDNPAVLNKTIPPERFFDEETISQFAISNVTWLMSIKPGIRNVSSYIDGRVRMEEIEVISLSIDEIPDKSGFFILLRKIHGKVMYPCVVLLEYHDKYKISARKIADSDRKTEGVVLKSSYISAWIRDPTTSDKTEQCVTRVSDLLLNGEGDIKKLYHQICSAILDCAPQYIGSRAHLSRLVYELTGIKNHPIINSIDSYKRYELRNPNSKFKKREYGSAYQYAYEFEDVWAAFMADENIHSIIRKRRYRDIEELVMRDNMIYDY